MASLREGPLHAFRIADSRRPIFDGRGAALYGGSWNSPGRRVIYASETYAGALLEKLVHTNIGRIPQGQRYIDILIPRPIAIEEIGPDEVQGWDSRGERASRAYGDRWYDERRSAVLVVPSVVTAVERNILINQDHPHFRKIRAGKPKPVVWDARLFRR